MSPERSPISKSTPVTIGFAVFLVGGLVGGFTLLDSRFKGVGESLSGLRTEVGEMTYSLREIRSDLGHLKDKSNGMLSRNEFDGWVRLLRAQNSDLKIPGLSD